MICGRQAPTAYRDRIHFRICAEDALRANRLLAARSEKYASVSVPPTTETSNVNDQIFAFLLSESEKSEGISMTLTTPEIKSGISCSNKTKRTALWFGRIHLISLLLVACIFWLPGQLCAIAFLAALTISVVCKTAQLIILDRVSAARHRRFIAEHDRAH